MALLTDVDVHLVGALPAHGVHVVESPHRHRQVVFQAPTLQSNTRNIPGYTNNTSRIPDFDCASSNGSGIPAQETAAQKCSKLGIYRLAKCLSPLCCILFFVFWGFLFCLSYGGMAQCTYRRVLLGFLSL